MKTWTRIAGITIAASLAATALLGGIVVYSGWYDVSATHQHTAPVYQLLETVLRRSVKLRAATIKVPSLDDTARVQKGFQLFRAHCLQCHGAPGIAPKPFALGLMPAPASLVGTAREWPAAEIFWVVRHGVKMSGMPAWQYRIDDDAIWDVVAFLKVLPSLSPADYSDWDKQHTPVPAQSPQIPATAPVANQRLGDIAAGRQALQQYLCATCHVIPGVVGANRHIGPTLSGIADRQYIAGVLPNTPANMVQWIQKPNAIAPMSAMPDLGVTEKDARDIAAFLYTLGKKE